MPPQRTDSSTRFPLTRVKLLRVLLTLLVATACALALPRSAHAEVWGYIDEQGQAHLAKEKVDDRYQIFFRGDPVVLADPQVGPAKPANAAPSATEAARAAPAAPVASASMRRVIDGPNASRYEVLIAKHAKELELDPALVKAVIAAESGFDSGAVSPKGARGLMQVMPDTAERYGVVGDRKQSTEQKLMDPVTNLRAGMRYLRDLLARFGNDVALTLAAYNAGEGAVQSHRNRIPPYPETQEYVKRVQAFYAVFRPADVVAPTEARAATPKARIYGTLLAQPRPDGTSPPSM